MYTVTSEIYMETNFEPVEGDGGRVVSKFKFKYPRKTLLFVQPAQTDEDGDLEVQRQKTTGVIEIEHSQATEIKFVGLQVWRGALLLADYIFTRRKDFCNKQILELGAGVGLASIAAGIYAKSVVSTDVNLGEILNLIRNNVKRNKHLLTGKVDVLEYDFLAKPESYTTELLKAIDESEIVVAADVIYDDDLTDALIRVIDVLFKSELETGIKKTMFLALEKRYVFTLSECDAVAPMFEHFIKQTLKKPWKFNYVPLGFKQYFEYERCKNLVLLQLTSF